MRQDTTYWGFKTAARHEGPRDVSLAATLRVESGFPWAPRYFEDLPNVGTVDFSLDDLRNLRSETVTIVDFRADKTFTFRDRYRFTVMADVYNLLNANPELDFVVHAGSDYRNIAEWLPGRTLRIGLRFQF